MATDDRRAGTEKVRYGFELNTPTGPARGMIELDPKPAGLSALVPVANQFTQLFGAQAEEHEKQQGREVSCRAGCGACCRQLVVLSIPEVLWIAEVVASLEADHKARVLARFETITTDLDARGLRAELMSPTVRAEPPHIPVVTDYFRLQHACPFLEDESCSIHAVRPVPCRDYNVTSPAENCRDPYRHPIDKVPTPLALTATLSVVAAQLTGEERCLIPLSLALDWAGAHGELAGRTWPTEELLRGLLGCLGRQQEQASIPAADHAETKKRLPTV